MSVYAPVDTNSIEELTAPVSVDAKEALKKVAHALFNDVMYEVDTHGRASSASVEILRTLAQDQFPALAESVHRVKALMGSPASNLVLTEQIVLLQTLRGFGGHLYIAEHLETLLTTEQALTMQDGYVERAAHLETEVLRAVRSSVTALKSRIEDAGTIYLQSQIPSAS